MSSEKLGHSFCPRAFSHFATLNSAPRSLTRNNFFSSPHTRISQTTAVSRSGSASAHCFLIFCATIDGRLDAPMNGPIGQPSRWLFISTSGSEGMLEVYRQRVEGSARRKKRRAPGYAIALLILNVPARGHIAFSYIYR